MRTHYQNLKVDEKAPLSVIKAAYRSLALEYHPDRRKADPEAERIFKIIQESYNVLCDPDKRRAHDEWIKSSRGKNGGGHKSPHSTKPARSYRPSNPAPFAFLVFTLIAAGLFWQFGQSELLYEVLDRYLVRKALPDQSIEEDISQSSDQVAQLIEPPRSESAVGVENAAITANEPVQISEDAVAQSDPVEESQIDLSANSEPTYETTREVLLDLYEKAGGDNWSDNTYWTDGAYCSWYGITCDEGPVGRADPQVVEINLNSNNLSGTITQRIGELSHLRRLQISSNDLWGTIPESIGNLKNLELLALNNNGGLHGEIPKEIGSLTNLKSLQLNTNALSGLLPLELSKLEKLRDLRIFQNQLVGEFFPAINGLTNLETIYAAANNLSGEIPPEISRLNKLEVLSLGGNRISGELPRELGFLVRLEYLGLQANQLRGEIPLELSEIPVLQRLLLQGNGLTGDIPTGLISPELRLDVSGNRLNPGQPIRFDNLDEDDWSMTIRGTAIASTDGLYLVVKFPKLLVRNPDSEVKQLRGLVAVVFEEGNYENTFQDSQWLASWVPIEPDQTRSLTEVEFRIPFGNIATSSMNNYRLGIKVYSTDSKEVDRRPPSSSEGWAWVRGSEKIVKEYVTEL